MDQAIGIDILRRRRLFRLAGGLLLCAGFLGAAWGINRAVRPGVAAADIVVAEVRRGTVDNTINAAGVVIPVREEVVSSPGASRVARVLAKPGQQVERGELLLELDDREIRLALDALKEQLAQQENKIATLRIEMEQKLRQTASAIELLEIDLQASRALRERNRKLRESGLVSGQDLLSSELNVQRNEVQLRQQRALIEDTRRATAASVAAARLQQEMVRKQIARQESLLEQTRVRAPFSGMLTSLVDEAGASVAAGQLVARISELNNYRVEATLSDFHARQLAAGQPVRVEHNGEVLAGRVHTILPEIQNGSIKLLVNLEQPHNPLLRNKMRVDANIVTERRANVLVIDSGSAFNGKGRQPVFAVREGAAHKTLLTLGASDGKLIEVVEGAQPGERFIVSSTSAFKDLDRVRITN